MRKILQNKGKITKLLLLPQFNGEALIFSGHIFFSMCAFKQVKPNVFPVVSASVATIVCNIHIGTRLHQFA